MDGSNADLLKLTSIAYNQAQRTRAEAWSESSNLPEQMQKEIKLVDQAVCQEDGKSTHLFSDTVTESVEKFVKNRDEDVWRRTAVRVNQPQLSTAAEKTTASQ